MNELSTMIEVAKHLSSLKPPDLQCMLLIRTYFMNIYNAHERVILSVFEFPTDSGQRRSMKLAIIDSTTYCRSGMYL
jgi:hypothetical protein